MSVSAFCRARRESVSGPVKTENASHPSDAPTFAIVHASTAVARGGACHYGHRARAKLRRRCARWTSRRSLRANRTAAALRSVVAVCVARNQPMAVAHDALNPFSGLRLGVLLERCADSLHQNDEGKRGAAIASVAGRSTARFGVSTCLESHGRRAVANRIEPQIAAGRPQDRTSPPASRRRLCAVANPAADGRQGLCRPRSRSRQSFRRLLRRADRLRSAVGERQYRLAGRARSE